MPKQSINKQPPKSVANPKNLNLEPIQPQTSGVRQPIYYSILTGLTPARLAGLLRASAETSNTQDYLTLAEEMEERDAHYRAVLNTRKQQILALPIAVNSVGEDTNSQKLKEFVETIVSKPKFKKMLFDLLDGLGKGYSVVEVEYELKNNLLIPANYIHRKPQWFIYDQDSNKLLLREDMDTNVEIVDIQAIQHIPQLKTGLPIRGGLARAVATVFLLKNYGIKDWAAFLEVYGMPLRIGKYGPGTSKEDVDKLMRAVADIGVDQAAVIPASMSIDFQNSVGAGVNNGELFLSYIKYMEEQISKAVLGQTMTTDNVSSKSQADVHNEVKEDIKRADALDLADTINDYIVTLINYNFGLQTDYPTIEFNTTKPEDREILANIAAQAVNMGMTISESDTRNRLGLKAPTDDSDILSPPATKVPVRTLPESLTLNSENSSSGKTDDIEDEDAKYLSKNWRKIMEPIEEDLRKALSGSNTQEEAINNIESLSLNTEYLQNDLAKQTTKEYVQGLKGDK